MSDPLLSPKTTPETAKKLSELLRVLFLDANHCSATPKIQCRKARKHVNANS